MSTMIQIPGLDTSDATATAARILSGYTAYAKGQKITGTYNAPTQYTYEVYVRNGSYIIKISPWGGITSYNFIGAGSSSTSTDYLQIKSSGSTISAHILKECKYYADGIGVTGGYWKTGAVGDSINFTSIGFIVVRY